MPLDPPRGRGLTAPEVLQPPTSTLIGSAAYFRTYWNPSTCSSYFPGKIKCQWQTAAGTARSPRDYTETTGAVEFAAGSRSTSINITIVDNSIAELGKTFTVELFNPEGGGKYNVSKNCFHAQ